MSSKKGKLIVFAAPSGAGKTSIVRHLMPIKTLNLDFSVSATTREPREGEVHGEHYYFLTVDDFKNKISGGDFIEWEEVYTDSFYGTLKSEVDTNLKNGTNVIFDIDVAGALSIKKMYKDEALLIFVKPPSLEALESRLRNRNTESERSLKRRVDKASFEMSFADQFDTIIVNDLLQVAQKQAETIVSNFIS